MEEILKIIDGYNQEKLHLIKVITAQDPAYYKMKDTRILFVDDCYKRIKELDKKVDDLLERILRVPTTPLSDNHKEVE
jgi:tetrahydromethanopterin S-methyltransferase subunit B